MTSYKSRVDEFIKELKEDTLNIFCTYQNDLFLCLEDFNLLQNRNNCLESSTAFGYILEEFIVAKLAMYTNSKPGIKFIIRREYAATTDLCYDCICDNTDIRFLVNVKVQKCNVVPSESGEDPILQITSENSAISAITQINNTYCLTDPDREKSLVILKIFYSVENGNKKESYGREFSRHIHIHDVDVYPIEYYDYSVTHLQDNRKWSDKEGAISSFNNGRLKLTNSFKKKHPLPEEQVSYATTKEHIRAILDRNRDKARKK